MATEDVLGTQSNSIGGYESRYAVLKRVDHHWHARWNGLGVDGDCSTKEILDAGWELVSFIDHKPDGSSTGLDVYFRRAR